MASDDVARVTVEMPRVMYEAFLNYCDAEDRSASAALRHLARNELIAGKYITVKELQAAAQAARMKSGDSASHSEKPRRKKGGSNVVRFKPRRKTPGPRRLTS